MKSISESKTKENSEKTIYKKINLFTNCDMFVKNGFNIDITYLTHEDYYEDWKKSSEDDEYSHKIIVTRADKLKKNISHQFYDNGRLYKYVGKLAEIMIKPTNMDDDDIKYHNKLVDHLKNNNICNFTSREISDYLVTIPKKYTKLEKDYHIYIIDSLGCIIYNIIIGDNHVCALVDYTSTFQLGDDGTKYYLNEDGKIIIENQGDVESLLLFDIKNE